MKAVKFAGERLVNYIRDGINWKDHKHIVLDFWKNHKCNKFGFTPKQFDGIYYVDQLPLKAQDAYKKWFDAYNFQNEVDKEWIEFVSDTLNLFYHTENPTQLHDDTWFIILFKSEIAALKIAESQIFHGSPNLNTFFKIQTNTKTEEVGGRNNGHIYSMELDKIQPKDVREHYFAIAFQCPESVKLYYKSHDGIHGKVINWASDCKNAVMIDITSSGRFLCRQTFVEGKAWREDRYIPNKLTPRQPMSGSQLSKYFTQNFYEMFGILEEMDQLKKTLRSNINQRATALSTLSDEKVPVSQVIQDTEDFILNGNVSYQEKEYNEEIRKRIKDKTREKNRKLREKMKQVKKDKERQAERNRNRLNFKFNKVQ